MAMSHYPLMSVEEYLELDRNSLDTRYEYIDGQVHMLAGGSPNHAKIGLNVGRILGNLLEGIPCSVYSPDVRVCLSEGHYVYPDVTVSCNEEDQEQNEMIYHPCLVVEVLSPSTEARDRGRKLAYYRGCPSIREYMLVDVLQPFVELFRRGRGNLWTYHTFGQNDDVELTSINVRFAVANIYEKVKFLS